jgi:hypothetical protein
MHAQYDENGDVYFEVDERKVEAITGRIEEFVVLNNELYALTDESVARIEVD